MGNEQSTPTAASATEEPATNLTRQIKAAKFAEQLERKRLENVVRKKAEREAVTEKVAAENKQADQDRVDVERGDRLEKAVASTLASASTPRKPTSQSEERAALQAKMEGLQREMVQRRQSGVGGASAASPSTASSSNRGRSDGRNGADLISSANKAAQALSHAISDANRERRGGDVSPRDAARSSPPRRQSLSVSITPALSEGGHRYDVSPRRDSNDSGIGLPRSGIEDTGSFKALTSHSRQVSGEYDRGATGSSRRSSSDHERRMAPPSKRPASTRDEQHPPKRPRIPDPSSASSRSLVIAEETADIQPPNWYTDLSVVPKRAQADAPVEPLLRALKTKITLCKDPRNSLAQQHTYNEIRRRIHELMFLAVNEKLLRNNSMLHNDRGLPQLFDERYSGGVDWPFDIKADAKELYFKWCNRVFETDLLRGIITGGGRSGSGDASSDKLDPDWPYRVSPEFHGNGQLVNGQWWPTQLAALRDGGHGSSQAGIYGKPGKGAFSCIMAGNPEYADRESGDRDDGDVVYYCGTDSSDGNITAGTNHMIASCTDGHPVRLIRSHKVQSKYAPEMGLRYDGLYDVVSYERLDPQKSLRQRHRFKLVRKPGQDPIRGGYGPEKRPTQQELETHQKDKRLRGVGGPMNVNKGMQFMTW